MSEISGGTVNEATSKATITGGGAAETQTTPGAPQPARVAEVKKTRKRKPALSGRIVEFALSRTEAARGGDGTAWAALPEGTAMPARSSAFKLWLRLAWSDANAGQILSSHFIDEACEHYEALALGRGARRAIHIRHARDGEALWLDLGERFVKATAEGWSIIERSDVLFYRAAGMKALPEPVRGGSLDPLKDMFALADDDWRLLAGWLLGAFLSDAPAYALALHGEQGSAKSFLSEVLKGILDPDEYGVRRRPRDAAALWTAARHRRVLAYDNLSSLPADLMDSICCLVSGKADAARKLYTDADESIFRARRVLLINGIPELAARGDLAERTLSIALPRIPEGRREPEEELRARLSAALPGILGALLDACVLAMRERRSVGGGMPRMADAARWIVAGAPALGVSGDEMLDALRRAGRMGQAAALESSTVATAVRRWHEANPAGAERTVLDWLSALGDMLEDPKRPPRDWPANSRSLGSALRHLAPGLRAVGIEVSLERRAGNCHARIGPLALEKSAEPPTVEPESESRGAWLNRMIDGDDEAPAVFVPDDGKKEADDVGGLEF